jgi:hypothetical protein
MRLGSCYSYPFFFLFPYLIWVLGFSLGEGGFYLITYLYNNIYIIHK